MKYSNYFKGPTPEDKSYLNSLPRDVLVDMADSLVFAIAANKAAGLSESGKFEGVHFCAVMSLVQSSMDYGLHPAQIGELASRWWSARKVINGCKCEVEKTEVAGLEIEV